MPHRMKATMTTPMTIPVLPLSSKFILFPSSLPEEVEHENAHPSKYDPLKPRVIDVLKPYPLGEGVVVGLGRPQLIDSNGDE